MKVHSTTFILNFCDHSSNFCKILSSFSVKFFFKILISVISTWSTFYYFKVFTLKYSLNLFWNWTDFLRTFQTFNVKLPKAGYTLITKYTKTIATNKKCIARYFTPLFSHLASSFPLFAFHSILCQGRHSCKKSKDFEVYFSWH